MTKTRKPYLYVSYPMVLASAAGHYVGRLCAEEGYDFCEPYDRLSGYFREKDEAFAHLKREYPDIVSARPLEPGLCPASAKALADYRSQSLTTTSHAENAIALAAIRNFLRSRSTPDKSHLAVIRTIGKSTMEMTRPLATDVVQAIAREPSETKPESEEETISALRMLMTEIEEIDRLEKHPEPVAEASPAPAFRL